MANIDDYNFNPTERSTVNKAIDEGVNSMIRAQAEKDLRKDIADELKDQLGLKPADFNALVKERYSNDISEKIKKFEAIVELNETLQAKNIADNTDED